MDELLACTFLLISIPEANVSDLGIRMPYCGRVYNFSIPVNLTRVLSVQGETSSSAPAIWRNWNLNTIYSISWRRLIFSLCKHNVERGVMLTRKYKEDARIAHLEEWNRDIVFCLSKIPILWFKYNL